MIKGFCQFHFWEVLAEVDNGVIELSLTSRVVALTRSGVIEHVPGLPG